MNLRLLISVLTLLLASSSCKNTTETRRIKSEVDLYFKDAAFGMKSGVSIVKGGMKIELYSYGGAEKELTHQGAALEFMTMLLCHLYDDLQKYELITVTFQKESTIRDEDEIWRMQEGLNRRTRSRRIYDLRKEYVSMVNYLMVHAEPEMYYEFDRSVRRTSDIFNKDYENFFELLLDYADECHNKQPTPGMSTYMMYSMAETMELRGNTKHVGIFNHLLEDYGNKPGKYTTEDALRNLFLLDSASVED